MGALHMDRRFLTRNSRADKVTSATRPTAKVRVDRANPITVRYWKCQPYASFLERCQWTASNARHEMKKPYARLGLSCMLGSDND